MTDDTTRPAMTVAHNDGMAMIHAALTDDRIDADKLQKLLDVKQQWESDEARKAFARAVAQFQASAPIIEPKDNAHGKTYARMDRIWRTIRPLMDACGLSITWQGVRMSDGVLSITGALMHADGHSVKLSYDLPIPEQIKGQNAAQVIGSATTYAKRYCVCSALNIVTGDDDDGNMAGGTATISEEQAANLRELCDEAGKDATDRMLAWAGVERIGEFPASKYDQACITLKTKIEGRQ